MKSISKSLIVSILVFILLFSSISYATSLNLDYHEDDTQVGRKDPNGDKFYYHPDHLGSTTVVTNQTGDVVEETLYEPYGEVLSGGDSRYLYTGKELDDQSGLYYLGARYYDPFLTRFTQPDEEIPDPYNPQDLNRYSYVRNNPYKYVDPTGEIPIDVIVDVGFIAYGVYQFARNPSLRSAGELGADVAFAFIPFLPNIKRIKEGAKALGKAEDVKGVGRAGEKASDTARASRELTQQESKIIKSLDRIEKDVLDRKTIEAVVRESKGEIVGRAAGDLRPSDHLKKITDAQKGLRNDLSVLQRSLKDPKLTGTQRQAIEKSYGRTSKQYDLSKRITKKYKKKK